MQFQPGSDQHGLLDPGGVLAGIGEALYDWDVASDALVWSAGGRRVLAELPAQTLAQGRAFEEQVVHRSGVGRAAHVLGSRDIDGGAGVAYALRYALRLPGGRILWVEDTGRWFVGLDGRPGSAHGALRVIRKAEPDLAGNDNGDPLVASLPPQAFMPAVDRLLLQHRELTGSPGAAGVMLSFRNLGQIARDHGHDVAQRAYENALRRLTAVLRRADHVMRGEDGAVVVFLSPCDPAAVPGLAERFRRATCTPAPGLPAIRIKARALAVTPDMRTAADVLRALEAQLQRPAQAGPATLRTDAAGAVLAALNDRRVALVYQPIVDSVSGAPAFHEALARIRLPDGLLLGAARIVPVAERNGLVHLLDQRVLELAARTLAERPQLRLSVNASALSIGDDSWNHTLASLSVQMPAAMSRLIVEVTESAVMVDPAATCRAVERIKAAGARVALDDFGAGQTSFRLLRDLGADMLKIDGAFVQNIRRSADDRFFVRTLIDLARHRGMEIVAEWVQDAESARMLADWGVDYLQGDYVGLPEEKITLQQRRRYRISGSLGR